MIMKILRYNKEDRNQEDIEILKKFFKEVKLFKDVESQLPVDQFNQLFYQLKIEQHKKNKTLFRYGSCYELMPKDDVEIQTKNRTKYNQEQQTEIDEILQQNPNMKLSAILYERQPLGELVINQKIQRSTTIICRENTSLVTINIDQYYFIIDKYFTALHQQKIHFLRQFPFLSLWSNSCLSQLLQTIKTKEYIKSQVVFKKSDPVQYIYLISQGEFEILQDIEAGKEESQQPLEQYKQSIEQFYQGFNELNIQFHRSKKQEQKKQQRIALLGVGQSFGINEIAENLQKRQATAICISTNSEVYLIDKQAYLNSAQEQKIYKDFIHENTLKQTWRNQQIESSKNLFQKFEYRKYNIQTNKTVKQIKGLCEIPIETTQSAILTKQNNFIQNGKQNTLDYQQQQNTKNFNFNLKIKQFSQHTSESTQGSNMMNIQTARVGTQNSQIQNLQEYGSLSPLLEKQFDKQNKRSSIKINSKHFNNTFETRESTNNQISQILNLKSDSDREINEISTIIPQNSGISSKSQIQRKILSQMIKDETILTKKNSQIQGNYFQSKQIYDQNENENMGSRRQSNTISPKKIYQEELQNKLSIYVSEKEQKKKNKQAQKYNALASNTAILSPQENSKQINELTTDNLQSQTPKGISTPKLGASPKASASPKSSASPKGGGFSERVEQTNLQRNTNRRFSRFRRKKSSEVIRSERLDSSHHIKELLGTQELTDRFQEMVEIENKLQEQHGRLQPSTQPENNQQQQRRDSNTSVQSLKCFEKIFQEPQQTINKRIFQETNQSRQYLSEVKSQFNINREQEILDQITRRKSANPTPTIQISHSLEGTEDNRQTPRNSNTFNKFSTFFSASRESISPQSTSQVGTQIYNEKYELQQQQNNNKNDDFEKNKLNQNKNEERFSSLIFKNPEQYLSPKNSSKNILPRRFTQFNEQISVDQIENNLSSLKEEKQSKQDIPLIPLNRINQKNTLNNICNPNSNSGRISSLSSFKNDDIQQNEQSQKLQQIKENPIKTVIDYNFIDSSHIIKHQKIQNPNVISYESKSSQSQNFSTQRLDSQESPLKNKRATIQIECEELATSKSSFSQFTQKITNSSTLSNLGQLNKFDITKIKSSTRSSINQIEACFSQTPEKGSSQVVLGINSKLQSQTTRPNYFKKETICQEIQQNKPKSTSNQKQFLYHLLNKNTSTSQHQNSNISNVIPLQPFQKDLYKFQESYYKKPINQSVITASSLPRKIIFQFQKKDSNNPINNSNGSINSNLMRKTLNHINQIK